MRLRADAAALASGHADHARDRHRLRFALKSIDFKVRGGELIVLCGPSGSGKSTLVRCISKLEAVLSGRIVVDGIDLTASRQNVVGFGAFGYERALDAMHHLLNAA